MGSRSIAFRRDVTFRIVAGALMLGLGGLLSIQLRSPNRLGNEPT
jgi:hypothetical protein